MNKEERSSAGRVWRARMRAEGRCTYCGKPRTHPDRLICGRCRDASSIRNRGATIASGTPPTSHEESASRFKVLLAIGADPNPEARWEDSPACQEAIAQLGAMTLEEIGWMEGVTRERIRQIIVKECRRIRQRLVGVARLELATVLKAAQKAEQEGAPELEVLRLYGQVHVWTATLEAVEAVLESEDLLREAEQRGNGPTIYVPTQGQASGMNFVAGEGGQSRSRFKVRAA
jgi:hypothetical protein